MIHLISQKVASLTLITFVTCAWLLFLLAQVDQSTGFIVFLGNTTACDTCDEYQTYSGRNVLCCLAQTKCCGPNNFDELKTQG